MGPGLVGTCDKMPDLKRILKMGQLNWPLMIPLRMKAANAPWLGARTRRTCGWTDDARGRECALLGRTGYAR